MELIDIIILAMIGEALWETLKMLWQDGKVCTDKVGAMLVGILIAIVSGVDVFQLLGFKMNIPFIGVILTGLLLSRGSNFVHDIVSSMSNVHLNTKQQTQVKSSEIKKIH